MLGGSPEAVKVHALHGKMSNQEEPMSSEPTGPGGRARRMTLADVADAAGVSIALVSIVMRGAPGASEATRAKVKQVADGLGYLPDRRAQKLRQLRSGLVGASFELHQPFHGDLVEQLYVAAAEHGFDLALSCVTPNRDEGVAVGDLIRERCEAAVLLGSRKSSDDLRALSSQIPALVIARPSGTSLVGSVRTDDTAGIAMAVDHLVALGHQRVLHITGGDSPGSAERRESFTAQMTRHGLNDRATVTVGGPTETDGAKAVAEAFRRPGTPTAIVAFNDRCAVGVLEMLLRQGVRVPDDVSVIGYDDSRLAKYSHISLSTVAQDAETIARQSMNILASQLAGASPAAVTLPPRLIVRDTTAPAPSDTPKLL